MEKNTAGKWIVFAYGLPDHANPGQAVTGDSANITANIRIDGGAANAVDDTNPTELEDGYYIFDITAAEANGDNLVICPASATANVQVIGVPGAVWTTPANFPELGIESDGDLTKANLCANTTLVDTVTTLTGHTAQTGDNYARLGAPAGASIAADLVVIDNFVDDLETRLTAARAGYLDNLNGHTAQTGDSYARLGAPAGLSVSADIAAIEAQTDDIGAAGAGLTAVPWNASWDAEVQSEVTDALNAYDPPTKTELDSAFTEIKGATWSSGSDTLEHIRDKLTDIETDTAEIGAAGAGLTNINLPNQTMDITGNITGNLSGSVGSVTGSVGSISGVTFPTNFADLDIEVSTGRVDVYQFDGQDLTVGAGVTINAELGASATAMDNFEAMYDGTGYTDDTAPASRSQVDGIGAASGGSLNFSNEADNVDTAIKSISFDGVETSGTNASVNAEDGTYHQIDDTANNIDIVYQFDIGGGRTAVEVVWHGYLSGANDSMTVQAYNGSGWDTLRSVTGKAGTTNDTEVIPLLATHTLAGADLGKVIIRLECAAQTNPTLYTDQLLVSAVNIGQSVGYSGGAVWIDGTDSTNTNTESFVDGVADNPVQTLAAARTIADQVGIKVFHLLPGTAETLGEEFDTYEFIGAGYSIALAGQSIEGATFADATITGIGVATSTPPKFYGCVVGTATLPPSTQVDCTYTATMTMGSAGDYFVLNGRSGVAGSGSPTFDYNSLGASTTVNIRSWSGGLAGVNIAATTVSSWEFENGGTAQVNGTGGDVYVRGRPTTTTDNSGGSVNLDITGVVNRSTINTEADTALTDYDPPTRTELTTDTNSILTRLGTPADTDVSTDIGNVQTDTTAIVADTNELQTDWANGGRLDLLIDAILADTGELQTDWADGGRLDLIVDAIVADTNELQTDDVPGLIAALENIAASDVLTQVNAALDTAIAELGVGAPTATPSLRTGLMLLYMMARNRVLVSTSGTDAMKIYNDAGTQIASKVITDDGTDYNEAEMS